MKRTILALAALVPMAFPALAQEVNVLGPLPTFTLEPPGPPQNPQSVGVSVNGSGHLQFPTQNVGYATLTGIVLNAGQTYTLLLGGQDTQQGDGTSVHFGFLGTDLIFDYDLGGFGNPVNFSTTFTFTGATGPYTFQINNVCNGPLNCEAKVENVQLLTAVAVPGPVAGAALPILLGFGGWMFWRRRQGARFVA